MYRYNLISLFIEVNYKFHAIINESYLPKNNILKSSLCEKPCSLYRKIILSQLKTIAFRSVVNIIPSIVKCRIYYNKLVRTGLIIKAKYNEIYYQIFEINEKIYKKYILFNSIYSKKVDLFLNNIRGKRNSIGIHYRVNDKCFVSSCKIKSKAIERINCDIIKMTKFNNSVIFISTVNNGIAKLLARGYRLVEYMPEVTPVHISKINRTITNDEVHKTVGDILFIASAEYLILSKDSTFSYLILALSGKNSFGKMKNFSIYDKKGKLINKSYMDMLQYIKKCTNAVLYSL